MYKEIDAEVEIYAEDVERYIRDYATDSELKEIARALSDATGTVSMKELFKDRGMDGGFIRNEKLELLSAAYHKFSLSELEQKLGNKFDLM